jgi:osmotically inducible lipoprotein OsmB
LSHCQIVPTFASAPSKQPRPPLFVGDLHNRFWEQDMSRISYLALFATLALATAGCGETPGTRALTGGAIGAGGGALVGAAAGNPAAGAIVGGLGGAAIGAATTPRQYYY